MQKSHSKFTAIFKILPYVFVLLHASVFAQTCLQESVVFLLQSEIDDFASDYPGCSQIIGNVNIEGDDITNLDGLAVLTEIQGELNIYNAVALNSLSGLDNLTNIGAGLHILNSGLVNLDAFSNLSNIETSITISENAALESIA